MKPYYEHAGITIYNGDCREILPALAGDWLVVSDPPYGINHRRGRAGDRGKGATTGTVGIAGDKEPFDPSHLYVFSELLLWGANYYAKRLPEQGRWLIWDKQCHGGSGDFSEAEIAWHSEGSATKFFRHMWLGVQRDSEVGESRLHPMQKPVALMLWCIKQSKSARPVLDPYMGVGPTLVAAKTLGRRAIGIEIEERYCEIAAKRLSQEVLPFAEVSR